MAVRKADATWNGSLGEGSGTMNMASGAWSGPYSVGSRFGEDAGTNPEELIAAAHAGCFSMALSAALTRAGLEPTRVSTSARVHINSVPGGFAIDKIELDCEAVVPGIDEAQFQEMANATKTGCPVSAALAAVPEITLDARLLEA
ncbi:MAG: OsmC family protein [Anaerolineaceae bacterium]|nr:OsmC family protein [Anaerolineaceae bacterium]